ncbi:MAG: hypothetical protein ACRDZW_09365 [Acidimicrobiales bacterium]
MVELTRTTVWAAAGGAGLVVSILVLLLVGHANPAMTMRVSAHAVEGADRAVADTLNSGLDQ